MPKPTRIRDDGTSPVLQLQTETDLFGLGFYPARQPDTDRLRTWEVAGTAHADQSTLDYGIESGHEWSPDTKLDFNSLCGRINDGPQTWVVRAALAHLATWAGGGTPPPKGPPLEVVDGKLARDADGNALGGIRMPASNVPTETLTGEADQAKSVICSLFGASTPFAPDKLKALYPTKQSYVDQVRAAARQAVDAGFLLPADQPLVVQQAEASAIPPT